jgi:hypothetical protein
MRLQLKVVGLLPILINIENEGKSRREARQQINNNVVVNRENVCVQTWGLLLTLGGKKEMRPWFRAKHARQKTLGCTTSIPAKAGTTVFE